MFLEKCTCCKNSKVQADTCFKTKTSHEKSCKCLTKILALNTKCHKKSLASKPKGLLKSTSVAVNPNWFEKSLALQQKVFWTVFPWVKKSYLKKYCFPLSKLVHQIQNFAQTFLKKVFFWNQRSKEKFCFKIQTLNHQNVIIKLLL